MVLVQSVTKMSTPSRRKCLRSQTRETIAKIYDFLKKDAKEILELVKNPVYDTDPVLISELSDHLNVVRKRTAEAAGVSERTVTNILAEVKLPGSRCKSPFENRKKRPKINPKQSLDSSDTQVKKEPSTSDTERDTYDQ